MKNEDQRAQYEAKVRGYTDRKVAASHNEGVTEGIIIGLVAGMMPGPRRMTAGSIAKNLAVTVVATLATITGYRIARDTLFPKKEEAFPQLPEQAPVQINLHMQEAAPEERSTPRVSLVEMAKKGPAAVLKGDDCGTGECRFKEWGERAKAEKQAAEAAATDHQI